MRLAQSGSESGDEGRRARAFGHEHAKGEATSNRWLTG
jgi:hypothetical protein